MQAVPHHASTSRWRRALAAAVVWLLAWGLMVWLDGRVDLASQALLLVLAAAVAAVGWPLWLSLLACLAAVLAFNFSFVPPRGSFSVDLHQHALLLLTMFAVSVVVAVLMTQQRRLALRERRLARQSEQLRRLGERRKAQNLRNTLLAAISHDYRTPLATILGAASSLHDQADRLSIRAAPAPGRHHRRRGHAAQPPDRQHAAAGAAGHARPGAAARLGVGRGDRRHGAAPRARQRDPARRVRARVEPGCRCCGATRCCWCSCSTTWSTTRSSTATAAPVEVLARRAGDQVVLAVRDRGPGVRWPAWRDIFEVFQRGTRPTGPRGAGVGLAVCRAIARAHGGELRCARAATAAQLRVLRVEAAGAGGGRMTHPRRRAEPPALAGA
jgi:K+-sensing histidine kinase KdpD